MFELLQVRANTIEIYVRSGKCLVGHMSGQANFYQNSIRLLMSDQFTVRSVYCLSGKCPSIYCLS